ncbi:hypothetical protein TRFO_14397 [Tritrichomonas foetus]|uniref:Man1/Src1-like C-terminal domain-containing protein n=1 Tax=Tritrichomonas foetus TaxID=1144522 RepID=A0A1J4KVM9_9EUKA|nr:hypothetical protein TRFO_14397 [Tritrichomonas foetus]|eukprot:OHT15202.1 hypothetical protein TRFO_14397 [Tritrichomonas foetus]
MVYYCSKFAFKKLTKIIVNVSLLMSLRSPPLNRLVYQKHLESRSKNELVEILKELGQPVDYRASKETIINRILSIRYGDNKPKVSDLADDHPIKKMDFVDLAGRVLVILLVILLLILLYIISHQPIDYCDSDSKQSGSCVPCPARAFCSKGNVTCDPYHFFINDFCLQVNNESENENESLKMISLMLKSSKNLLKRKAGQFKCEDSNKDWISQDDLEYELKKRYNSKNIEFLAYLKNFLSSIAINNKKSNSDLFSRNNSLNGSNFSKLFNSTIFYLKNETNVVTRIIENSTVFVATDVKKPMKCVLRSIFYKNILFAAAFAASFAAFYVWYLSHKQAERYRVKADQCITALVTYIKSFKGFEISQSQLREKMENMVDDPDGVWKYVVKGLERSPVIRVTKRDDEVFYHSFR